MKEIDPNVISIEHKVNLLAERLIEVCKDYATQEEKKKRDHRQFTADVWIAISKFVPAMLALTIGNAKDRKALLKQIYDEAIVMLDDLEKEIYGS